MPEVTGSQLDPFDVALGINELNKSKVDIRVPEARARAFMPRPEDSGRLALSTFCVDGLEEIERWSLLGLHVTPLLARVEKRAQSFRDAGLIVDPDNIPERHVNVLGWPLEREACKAIAQESLCTMQKFVLRPAS